MSNTTVIAAEIRVTEALLKQSRVLADRNDPHQKIAAAQWELRFQAELDKLTNLRDLAEVSNSQSEAATAGSR